MAIQQCRGIESFETNDDFIIVQAPVNLVSEAWNQTKQVTLWERDVYGREVNVAERGFVVFQFQGHPWTLIHNWNFPYYSEGITDAQILSRSLDTRAFYYAISDTTEYIGYEFYERGLLLEKLEYGDNDLQFESQLRQLKQKDIGDPFEFTQMFIREHDIYIPLLFWAEFRVGQSVPIMLNGIAPGALKSAAFPKSDFERVDYLTVMETIRVLA